MQHIAIYLYIFASNVKCVFEPSKEEKSKTINDRSKTETKPRFVTSSFSPPVDAIQ